MALFIQNDATGVGAGTLKADVAFANLAVIANGDTGLGLDPAIGNRQQVSYFRTLNGAPPIRLDAFVNTPFSPDYGSGPVNVDTVILAVDSNFTLNDGTSILVIGGTALAPQSSGLPGSADNTTEDCLVIYDTSQNNGQGWCMARAGSGGTLDLQTDNPVILYHELSHAFRIVTNAALALSGICNPSSPEENAAITEENDLRTQMAASAGTTAALRDPGIHCGQACGAVDPPVSCCIVASVATGSPLSREVVTLRGLRDSLIRRTEVGFELFRRLFFDYYEFSPQVATLMARRADLTPMMREGYVQPLITILRLVKSRGLEGGDLGVRFAALHPDPEAAARTLAMLRQARSLYVGDAVIDDPDYVTLRALLDERAWPSPHVQWALLEPILIYAEALEALVRGDPPGVIGERLTTVMGDWGARMPIDPIWGMLSAGELAEELAYMDAWLLKTPGPRAAFRERLLEQFPEVTAIRAAAAAGGDPKWH